MRYCGHVQLGGDPGADPQQRLLIPVGFCGPSGGAGGSGKERGCLIYLGYPDATVIVTNIKSNKNDFPWKLGKLYPFSFEQ